MEDISLAQIRQLFDETFSDEELEVLCFDHYMEVYNNFAVGMTKIQKLLRLLSYCRNRDRMPELIELLNRARPGLIERRFPDLLQSIDHDATPGPESEGDSTEDLGYLDVMEFFEDHFNSVTVSLGHMMEATEDVSSQMGDGTTQINALQTSGNIIDVRTARRIVSRTADDLEIYAKRMEAEVLIYAKAFQNGIDSLNRAMVLLDDLGEDREEQVVQVRAMLQQLETSIDSSDAPLQSFRNSISDLPNATITLNKAKRHAVGALDSLLVEFARSKAAVRDAQGVLNGLGTIES